MENITKNHSQERYYNANVRTLIRTGIAFLSVLFLLISCKSKVHESQNSVSVSGIGTVLAQPDMVLMNVSFSHTAPTAKEAKKAAEQTIQRILKVLQEESVEDKFMKTISLNYDVEYDYRSGRRVRLGQRAQQTVVVTVNDVVNTPERFSSILDKIIAIDRVEVQNIQFDIENKTELFRQSRELAYQKAFDKAKQYAELSGRKTGKVLTISEGVSQDIAQPRVLMNHLRYEAADGFLSGTSSVPTGEQGVTSEINVHFSLE
jgi:uncharacterized protein YggE